MSRQLIYLIILTSVSGLSVTHAQNSYIVVHVVNPEGVEIGSIDLSHDGQYTNEPAVIFADSDPSPIASSAHNESTHNVPIALSAGTHTIRAEYNGMKKQQVLTLAPGETHVVTFSFERTEFDLVGWIESRSFPRAVEDRWQDWHAYLSIAGFPSPTESFDHWLVQVDYDGWIGWLYVYPAGSSGELDLFNAAWPGYSCGFLRINENGTVSGTFSGQRLPEDDDFPSRIASAEIGRLPLRAPDQVGGRLRAGMTTLSYLVCSRGWRLRSLGWGPQTRCIAFGNPSRLRGNDKGGSASIGVRPSALLGARPELVEGTASAVLLPPRSRCLCGETVWSPALTRSWSPEGGTPNPPAFLCGHSRSQAAAFWLRILSLSDSLASSTSSFTNTGSG
jgi:hypothetical protein